MGLKQRIILYGISMVTATIIEGEISGILRKKRMLQKLAALSDHFIVCGGGETGRPVLRELLKNAKQAVLIEQDETHIYRCLEERFSLLLLGTKSPGTEIVFHPAADSVIAPDTDLIVMGRVADVQHAHKWVQQHE